MPLVHKINLEKEGVVGVWHNIEGDEFFKEQLFIYPVESDEIKDLNGRKLSEWYCSRYLLHLLSGRHDRGACIKDDFGKPMLVDSDFEISISHSGEYTAVIGFPSSVGIDIQIIVTKIDRIKHKFATDIELASIDPTQYLASLHVIWGAKEAMYKAYGKRELDFKGHMSVEPFDYIKAPFKFRGKVNKNDIVMNFDLFCHTIDQYILIYAIEK